MRSLTEIWENGGLVRDTNRDGVPDHSNVVITGLTDSCSPSGLIDVLARLGLETSGLSFDFFDQQKDDERWQLHLAIDQELNELAQCQLFVESKQIICTASDESLLSNMLSWLASHWPQKYTCNEIVTRITFTNNQVAINEGQELTPLVGTPSVPKTIRLKSLLDLWGPSGFYQNEIFDPTLANSVGIYMPPRSSTEVLKAASCLAARIGLESTHLQFPVTQGDRQLTFSLQVNHNESRTGNIKLLSKKEKDIVEVSGNEEDICALLAFLYRNDIDKLNTNVYRQQVPSPFPVLLEKTWEDKGERYEAEQLVEPWLTKQPVIECYLSEPYTIRQAIKQKWENKGARHVVVRSSYKPGFFWLEEEVLPKLKDIKKQVNKIKISCQKDNYGGLELPIRWIQELYPIDALLAKELSISTDQVQIELSETQTEAYRITVYDSQEDILYSDSLEVPVTKMPYLTTSQYIYPTTSQVTVFVDNNPVIRHTIATDRERFWTFFVTECLQELKGKLNQTSTSVNDAPLFHSMYVEVHMSEEERRLEIDEERISSLEALHEDIYFNTLDYFAQAPETKNQNPGSIRPFMKLNSGGQPSAKVKVLGWEEPPHKGEVAVTELYFQNQEMSQVIGVEGQRLMLSQKTLPSDEALQKLAADDAVHIREVSQSFEGRPIYAVEMTSPTQADIVSVRKLSLYKPTLLIETGHHANEVSSMPAVQRLAHKILSEHKDILSKLNIVFIPCANPDGRALHQELIKDHPEWKHHAARYNAVGLEFRDVRFKETIFGEADVIPYLVSRWLPDVYVDDHGIPSHEWTQPFAGYNSPPRFPVSYWIPNALVYGIARQLDKDQYPQHHQLLDQAIKHISRRVNQNQVTLEKNRYWRDRYIKYGHQWLPDVFPLEYENDMIFYIWPTQPQATSPNYIERFPEWCSLEIVSETADETVYGETLEQCIQAHIDFNWGLIEWLATLTQDIEALNHTDSVGYMRRRPLRIY